MFIIFFFSKALDMHLSVGILRLQNGLDYSNLMLDEDGQVNEQSILATRTRNNSTESLPRNQSYTQMSQGRLSYVDIQIDTCVNTVRLSSEEHCLKFRGI